MISMNMYSMEYILLSVKQSREAAIVHFQLQYTQDHGFHNYVIISLQFGHPVRHVEKTPLARLTIS